MDYARIEYTLNGETQINYVDAMDGVEEEKRLRSLGAWIHDVSYGTYRETYPR
jgi:hypothetical protein